MGNFNPFQAERRYGFATLTNSIGGSDSGWPEAFQREPLHGLDEIDGRVVDVFVRVHWLDQDIVVDIPLDRLIRAELKPCLHENSEWHDELGLICSECKTPFLLSFPHCKIARKRTPTSLATGQAPRETQWELWHWEPRVRGWNLHRIYRSLPRAVEVAGMLTSGKLACFIERE